MTLSILTNLAESMPSKKRMNYADMVAPVATLKAKGYTFREIHALMIEKGIPVSGFASFASSMSQHFSRRKNQLSKP